MGLQLATRRISSFQGWNCLVLVEPNQWHTVNLAKLVGFLRWKPLQDVHFLNVVIPDFFCSWVDWQEPTSTGFRLLQEIPKQKQFRPKVGFNFRVFPLSHETWSMVEPRMQAGLSSPHFDELRMEPLGSPICWGSVMKDWNHWNHLRDSRNCFCFSCVWGKLSQSELKLSGHYNISWNLAVLTWKNSGSLWAMTEAPNRVETWMTSWFLVCLNPLISWCGMLNYWNHVLCPTVLVWGI